MKDKPDKPDATRTFERLLAGPDVDHPYVLRLFITGMTPRSAEAIASIKAICQEHFPENHELEIIDIYQHPAAARDEQIIAAPTLIKEFPRPLKRLIGNLQDKQRVLTGLGLRPVN